MTLVSKPLLIQVEQDEGFRQIPYRDSVGRLTVGYGFNLTDVGLSQEESERLLASRLEELSDWLQAALPWTSSLDDPRRDVLINMAYNMGKRGLLSFHATLRAVQEGRWEDASNSMAQSEWAEEVGNRAKRLRTQMITGVVQFALAPLGTPEGKWKEL